MITRLAIAGYRSLRDVRVELGRLNIVTGPNGSGKSSLYRALRLLADIAQGRIIRSLAAEGGLQSTLWAGPEVFSQGMKRGTVPIEGTLRRGPVSLRLGFSSPEYGYAIDLGLPPLNRATAFSHDPQIKTESLWTGETLGRANEIARRRGSIVQIRDDAGAWCEVFLALEPFDSMVTHYSDPVAALELLVLRERMRGWRFYDHFRTDAEAPARQRQIGTHTPVLAGDGADLAAALQTIIEIGDGADLAATIADAFPEARIEVARENGQFDVLMVQRGLLRPLRASELSDGTLRYLLLVAALLSPRPPALMVLNEPETSLHPDLLAPLGRLIALAAARSQLIVVTHSSSLIAAIDDAGANRRITLSKTLGETIIEEDEDRPGWNWPAR